MVQERESELLQTLLLVSWDTLFLTFRLLQLMPDILAAHNSRFFIFFSPQIKIVKTFFWFCCSEEIIFSIIFFFHYLLLFFQRQLHFSVETVCILVNGVAFALGDFLYCLLHSLRVHFIVKSRFFISRIIESKTTDRDDETGSEPKN